MDAQNAVESANPGPASSTSRRVDQSDGLKTETQATASTNSTSAHMNGRSSPEHKASIKLHGASPSPDNEPSQDQNSDAETIVLAGKDGISPSKPRQGKFIKHEDKSDGEVADVAPAPRKVLKQLADTGRNGSSRGGEDEDQRRTPILPGKKRLQEKEKHPRNKEISSGLTPVPGSPPPHHRHKPADARSESGSEEAQKARASASGPNREKSRNGEKNLSVKRRTAKLESDDDEPKKARRPRVSDSNLDFGASKERDHRSGSAKRQQGERNSLSQNRSASPHSRPHRRSLSTQLPSQSSNGLGTKKRRVPAPLQATDYQSDDSSASGSSHPRNTKVRRLVTPLTAESTNSPAKTASHKRHVDNHGQTPFAKACAKGEYEIAKRRLAERPEDLDYADYAGNTPLQVAALNGHEDIVKLLIEAGCNLDCRNSDKETPLLDAVENGHLEVVKLLLDAGVNPRKADAEGHEPLEKVPDDLENAEEIRAVLREAKDKSGEFRPSEDRQPQDPDRVSSQGPDSPRRSPQASSAAQRRGGTVRSTKTSNHLLYMNLDEKTLRHAAARGDEETVTRVLQVREGCDDPEALVGAARGGHNVVMELLLALGGANPDPAPVKGLPPQYSTPMLAAIGQENAKVIKLLLNQSGFDPTRRFKGECYHEIARRREGPLWKEEEHMLKNAYDEYRRAKGSNKKTNSNGRRERESEGDSKRSARKESSPEASRPLKRRPSSPTRDAEPKKKIQTSKAAENSKEKRRSEVSNSHEDPPSPKRASARPKKDEVVVNTNSDRESTPGVPKSSAPKAKRAESDLAAGSSDGEAFKPRRKLISGRDLKGQRERQRRSSIASTTSNDRADTKIEDVSEKARPERPSEKYHDRTKALKRDDSRDRLSGGEGSAKRHRASLTPPRQGTADRDDGEAPSKRRRLEAETRESRLSSGPSPDERRKRREASPDNHKRQRAEDSERKEKAQKANRERALSVKSTTSERGSITVASDIPEVEMRDAHVSEGEVNDDNAAKEAAKKEAATKKRQAEIAAAEEAKKDEERRRREEEEAAKKREEQEKKRIAEEKRQQEEMQRKQAEEEARKRAAEEEQRRREEEEKKKRLEEEEKARAERERVVREERERQEREEAERRQREEERKREEEARLLREAEEEKKRQEEEARIRREREAAEEARRLREEEERKERERKRAAREAEREAELQRIRQEQERIRLSKLPPLLRWLDTCPDPKQRQYAELFAMAQGVRYDTINPAATGTAAGREQWLLNTQVALLLGDKDLSLARYTAWEKVKASNIAKKVIWRLENERYALTQGKLYHLGMQLPEYYEGDPSTMGHKQLEKLRGAAAKLFFDMDLWFVKASDFLFMVPNFPHLRDVKISIDYRELPDTESALNTWGATPSKWKQDPDASSRGHFAPRWKYYINGQFAGEDQPKSYKLSRDPFPERRVPRRGGLIAVTPDEPDYAQLCLEQGLSHLLSDEQKQAALAGSHLTPKSMVSNEAAEDTNNLSPSERSPTKATNIVNEQPTSPVAQQ